jgi:hypothetical protein
MISLSVGARGVYRSRYYQHTAYAIWGQQMGLPRHRVACKVASVVGCLPIIDDTVEEGARREVLC